MYKLTNHNAGGERKKKRGQFLQTVQRDDFLWVSDEALQDADSIMDVRSAEASGTKQQKFSYFQPLTSWLNSLKDKLDFATVRC